MNKDLIPSLMWAGTVIGLALAANAARHFGYFDGETVTRIVTAFIGLMVVWYGNRMPKTFAPQACSRQANRVGGWAMVLSGAVYAGLWAFAPLQVAFIGGCGAILAGVAVTLGYCLSMRAKSKTA